MKKSRLYRTMVLTLAAVAVNIANAQETKVAGSGDKNETGDFFIQQMLPGAENKVYGSGAGIIAISQREKAAITYIEQLKEDEKDIFSEAMVKSHSGKNYLQWVVSSDTKNGIFVIERSENGGDFKTVGFKNRIGSSIERLSYYFQDAGFEGLLLYRILAIGEDGTYKYSETLKVENPGSSVQLIY